MKKLITALSFLALIIITTASAQAQTYSFECYCGWLANPDCGCTGNVNGMFFDGLLIKSGGKTVGRVLRGTEPKFTTASTIQFTLDDGRKLDIPRTRTGYTTNTAYKAAIEDCLCIEQVTVHPAATLTNNPGAFSWDVLTQTGNIPPQSVTTMTNTVAGNRIGTYTNEAGVVVQLNETITNLSPEINGIQYVNESGDTTVVDLGYLRDSVSSANGSVVVVQSPNSTGGVNYDLSAKSILLGNGPYQGQPCNGYLGAIDTVGVDTQYYCNNGVLTILRQAKQDSVWTVPDYTALRAVPISYPHDLIHVADWTYTGPDGNTYTTIGGVFKKVLTGSENGGTIIVGNSIWARDWDGVNVHPEWWEVGGYDVRGMDYASKNTLSALSNVPAAYIFSDGIYNDRDRIQNAIEVYRGVKVSYWVNVIYDGLKTYPIDIFINNGPYNLSVNGTHEFNQATIKRPNSPVVTLTASLSIGQTSITVSDATQFRVGQHLNILNAAATYGGLGYNEADYVTIIGISGNVITFSSGATKNLPIGSKVMLEATMFDNRQGSGLYRYMNGYFDGNKLNGGATQRYIQDWRFNYAIEGGTSAYNVVIENCHFWDNPGENCTFSRGLFFNNTGRNLDGSFFHVSMSDSEYTTGKNTGVHIDHCKVDGVCLATDAVSGHCEAAITNSLHTEYVKVTNCDFKNGLESVFALDIQQANTKQSYIFSDNICENFKYITNALDGGILIPEREDGLLINNNRFDNCGDIYMGTPSTPLSMYKGKSLNQITINGNIFRNSRFAFSNCTNLTFTNNEIYYTNQNFTGFTDWVEVGLNTQPWYAAFSLFRCSKVNVSDNMFEGFETEANTEEEKIAICINIPLEYLNRYKNSSGVAQDVYYEQGIKITGNTISNFHTGINCAGRYKTSPLNVFNPPFYQTVGWNFSDNDIILKDATPLTTNTRKFGIVALPGVIVKSNNITQTRDDGFKTGIFGICPDPFPATTSPIDGPTIVSNVIRGVNSGGDINIDGLGNGFWNYNAVVINNITKRPIQGSNAARNYVTNNFVRNATTLPAQTSPIVPIYNSFEENKTQY